MARYYRDWIDSLVVDEADAGSSENIKSLGIECIVTETVMTDPRAAASLGATLLGLRK